MELFQQMYKELKEGHSFVIADNTGFVILYGIYRSITPLIEPIVLQAFTVDNIELEIYKEKYKHDLPDAPLPSHLITFDEITNAILEWYSQKGIQNILKAFKGLVKARIAAAYELLTGKPIKLKGMSGVYYFEKMLDDLKIPSFIMGKATLEGFKKRHPNAQFNQYSYETLKKEEKRKMNKFSAIQELLKVIFFYIYSDEHNYLQIPTDKGSSEFTTFTLQKKTRTLKERFIKCGEVEIKIGSQQKRVKAEELDIFLSSLPHRTGDVYNYLLHKAYHQGFTQTDKNGSQRVLDINAQEIANALSPSGKAGRKLKETVAEILGEKLPAITIRVPTDAFTTDILNKLKVKSKSGYISFSPLIYLMGESEDDINEDETRLYRAVIAINPLLWALYAEIGMKTAIPIEVLRLNPQYTPERWAKMMTYKLYYYARVNQQNTNEHKVRMRTLLENTGIIEEIEEMIAQRNHPRAFSYLKQSLELMQSSLFKKFVILPKPPENLDEFLNSTLSYIVKQPHG